MIIRHPLGEEWAACRMLLPDCRGQLGRDWLVAVDTQPPYVLGVASFLQFAGSRGGLRVAVARGCRRAGVGRLLVQRAACGETSGWADGLTEPDAEAFARACGFVPRERIDRYAADFASMREGLLALCQRLREGGRIPPDARVATLREAPAGEFAQLWRDHIRGTLGQNAVEQRLLAGAYDESPVVLASGEVAGFLLATFAGEEAIVDAKVVRTGYRGSWVNALLMARSTDLGLQHGTARVIFEWRDGNRDTAKLAARFPGRYLRRLVRFDREPGKARQSP